jgi:hypothetical protein
VGGAYNIHRRDEKDKQNITVEIFGVKTPPGRSGFRWEDNIRMI